MKNRFFIFTASLSVVISLVLASVSRSWADTTYPIFNEEKITEASSESKSGLPSLDALDSNTKSKLLEMKELAFQQLESGHDYDGKITGFFNEWLKAVDGQSGAVDELVAYIEEEMLRKIIEKRFYFTAISVRRNLMSGYFDEGKNKKAVEQERIANVDLNSYSSKMEPKSVYHSYMSFWRVFRGYTEVWKSKLQESGVSRQEYYLLQAKNFDLEQGNVQRAFNSLFILHGLLIANGRVEDVMAHYPELAHLAGTLGTSKSKEQTASVKKFIDSHLKEKAPGTKL